MNTREYDEFTESMWMNNADDYRRQVSIATLGLAGESGEAAEKVKKYLRGDYDLLSNGPSVDELLYELGDIAFYISTMARLLDSSLEEVLQRNVWKLTDRKARRGDLRGDGDHR